MENGGMEGKAVETTGWKKYGKRVEKEWKRVWK